MPRRRFTAKTNTSLKPPFRIYTSHSDSTSPVKYVRNGKEEIIICTIDPGSSNCGVFFLSYLPSNGKVYPLQLENLKFKEKGKDPTNSCYGECIRVLDGFSEIFMACHYVFIEEQLGFVPANVKIAHIIIGYLLSKYKDKGNRLLVIEINSSSKLRLLDCPYKEKKDYKKWAPEKALELLKEEFEENVKCIEKLEKKGKKDDIGDAVCFGKVAIKYIKNSRSDDPIHKIPCPC